MFDAFNKEGQQLIGAGFGSDPAMIREISTVNKEYHDVVDSVHALQSQLQDVLKVVEKFDDQNKETDKELTSIEERVEEMNKKPVAGEPEEINNQLEEIKVGGGKFIKEGGREGLRWLSRLSHVLPPLRSWV